MRIELSDAAEGGNGVSHEYSRPLKLMRHAEGSQGSLVLTMLTQVGNFSCRSLRLQHVVYSGPGRPMFGSGYVRQKVAADHNTSRKKQDVRRVAPSPP